MNILFILPSTCPYKGGVERISSLIANRLKIEGKQIYALTIVKDNLYADNIFSGKISIKENKNKIITWIRNNNIQLIINQLPFLPKPLSIIKQIKDIKIISCFHGSPTFYKDVIRFTLKDKNLPFYSRKKTKALIQKIIHPFYEPYGRIFRNSYQISSKFILLSERFIYPFATTYKIKSNHKFGFINNPLSLDTFYSGDFTDKENIVLIVSRLADCPKRISLMLNLWKKVEQHPNAQNWKLVIVGKGFDEKKLKKLALKLELDRCSFIGETSNVAKYYQKASLFLMASSYEGWGLTLTEAMQMGCVPIAFNTYLTLTEIIDNGKNGIVIPEDNNKEYLNAIFELMNNNTYRKQLAIGGIEKAKSFSLDIITRHWLNLIEDIQNAY